MKRKRRTIRALLALLVLSLGALASCSSLIGIDDYEGSAPALCGALAVCYGIENCEARVAARLEQAPSELRAEWLRKFSDFECVASCSAARRCLDFEPVCAYQGSCNRAEDCCGFIAGKAACTESECCAPRGVSCTTSEDCCDGDCSPITGTCGGVVCIENGEPCSDGFECCTGICANGQCAAEVCKQEKLECGADIECCPGLVCDAQSNRCAFPSCSPAGAPCASGCCDGLLCVSIPGPEGSFDVCSDCEFAGPLGSPCNTDEQCCSGRCDDEFGFCADASCPIVQEPCGPGNDCCEGICENGVCTCHAFGQSCVDNDDCCRGRCDPGTGLCACSEDVCGTSEDCCSGSCIAGVCALACGTTDCHDECKVGGPLGPGCGLAEIDDECVSAICDANTGDPYCCCFAWDDLCVQAALNNPICKATGPCG